MDRRRKLLVGILAALVVSGVGAGVGVAARGGAEAPLRGRDYDRATKAAVEHVGGGTVTETEAGDDGAAYEVEIRLDDGSQVEVQLDEGFDVIGKETDDDGADEGRDDD